MTRPYIEENEIGELVIYAPDGQEMIRFIGQNAFQEAIQWANDQGLELRSNRSPIDLLDHQRLYFRRRPRFLRLNRFNNRRNADPPNVKRVVLPAYDSWSETEGEGEVRYDDEEIELAPDEE